MSRSSSSPSPPLTPPTSDDDSEPTELSRFQTALCAPTISMPARDPFAASTKADRAPPAYEKKLVTPPATPPDLKKDVSPPHGQTRNLEVTESKRQSFQRSPSVIESEQRRWDAAISSVVDRAETKLDLSSANLTHIPPSIIDLKHLVVLSRLDRPLATSPPRQISTHRATATASSRTFTRSTTAPALLLPPRIVDTRRFLPSRTSNALVFGAAGHQRQNRDPNRGRCEVELYLMGNTIRTLPRELFALDCLVVLSLRQNKLRSLPSAIGQLMRLRELNVANNRLTHLPAEILSLRLTSLHLHPNPFTPSPHTSEFTSHLNPNPKLKPTSRSLGPLTCGARIPTLSELVLRILLAPAHVTPSNFPHTSTSRSETWLEAAMTLAEIDALQLPAHLRRVVYASTGHKHGRARSGEKGVTLEAEEDVTGNLCPSPLHRARNRDCKKGVRFLEHTNGNDGCDAPVFRTPVEERLEWVGVIAGVQVAENPKAWVPVLWRGCMTGCLAFLEDGKDPAAFEVGKGEGGEEFEFSDEDG